MTEREAWIRDNLNRVQARIAEAALRAGREPGDVRLVAVSKTATDEDVLAAWAAGQREFGENRPRAGAQKVLQVNRALDDATPLWHMIGHVQRRKTNVVVEHFDLVHAVDRRVFAEKLSRLVVDAGRTMPVLMECNVSGEASKYGYDANGWEQDAGVRDTIFAEVEAVLALPGMELQGLMTMAPIADDPEEVRPVFRSLRALLSALQERFPEVAWQHLSMGMTDDFEVAVEEGATLVRVGRAIFGPQ